MKRVIKHDGLNYIQTNEIHNGMLMLTIGGVIYHSVIIDGGFALAALTNHTAMLNYEYECKNLAEYADYLLTKTNYQLYMSNILSDTKEFVNNHMG